MTGSNAIRDTFFAECEELLEALIEGLGIMETPGHDPECVNAVFRTVHSVKGGAGAFGLDELVAFAHRFETLLDMLRNGEKTVDRTVMATLFKSADVLSDLVDSARSETQADPNVVKAGHDALDQCLSDAPKEDAFSFDAISLDFDAQPIQAPCPNRYLIRFRPHDALYRNGHEPHLILDTLSEMGRYEAKLNLDDVPPMSVYEDGCAHLTWHISVTTELDETAVQDVFEFVGTLCDLTIEQVALADDMDCKPSIPDSTAAERPVSSSTPATSPKAGLTPKPTLRVDLDRVDRLINAVGELIINQAMISQRVEELNLPSTAQLNNEIEEYKLLARDIQEGVMAIRAQPVKLLFQRMARIVRETSAETGKTTRLVTSGETTEVDKTVIERLSDPLTHMLRNAVDHGLESPEQRRASGKDETGTIKLSASHRSGSVIIEISDDGAGLDRTRIFKTAVEKGLIAADADLTESEIDNLLFLPGFSTANTVSNLSGRGVGMDVVRNAVSALGGRISISSIPGVGTTFTVNLPLTLAVMDGFVISVAQETMVVPIAAIFETVHPRREDIHQLGTDDVTLLIRGQYIPIIDVAFNLGLRQRKVPPEISVLLIVNNETTGLVALAIDDIRDQRQVVVKSLEASYGPVPGISSATILGDGRIALILDTDEITGLSVSATTMPLAPSQTSEQTYADTIQ
ncbi:MAG: chemotaxis protein CheA [Rhodobacteraceae bacterium]|nr:chemotaxis protein CheA [Paracoccaceae bacterium]